MRLIDADDLIERWQSFANEGYLTPMACIVQNLKDAPTIDIEERLNDAYAHGWTDAEAKYHDAVKVVRCKYCKHSEKERSSR